MSRKNWGYVIGGIGVLLILAALLGDSLWSGSTPGFGVGQIAALVLGIILLVIGLSLAFRDEPEAAAAPAPRVSAAPAATNGKQDDLIRLEGIGPKLQDVLRSAGFKTYTDLANATPEAITRVLAGTGIPGSEGRLVRSRYAASLAHGRAQEGPSLVA